jgi:CHAT domain
VTKPYSPSRKGEIKALSGSGELSAYRIVHFATHGAVAGELKVGTEPGLVLTPPTVAAPEDDGYLSASEIAGLKLDADWVILSACNTAAGGAEGAESLSGMARAFFLQRPAAKAAVPPATEVLRRIRVLQLCAKSGCEQAQIRALRFRTQLLLGVERGGPTRTARAQSHARQERDRRSSALGRVRARVRRQQIPTVQRTAELSASRTH